MMRIFALTTVVMAFLAGPTWGSTILFLSGDLGVTVDGNNDVTAWADLSGNGNNAILPGGLTGPAAATASVNSSTHDVLRFTGAGYLTAPIHVPSTGTLAIVYSYSGGGGRLLGWENTGSGENGFGLIPNEGTGEDIIARDNGGVGDIDAAPPASTEPEVDVVTWGPAGVTLNRELADGAVTTFSNTGISAISDAGYDLNIGAPGNASGPWFQGDVYALEVLDTQLDANDSSSLLSTFYANYLTGNPVPEPSMAMLLVIGLGTMTLGRRGGRACG
jgi:hypothetical protein